MPVLFSETEGNIGAKIRKGVDTSQVGFADLLSYLHGPNKHE